MSWKPEFIVLLFATTLVDYYCAIKIDRTENKKRKKLFLFFSMFSNLGLLFSFKYFNFFDESAVLFLKQFSISFDPITLRVILPVGISFYTFQTMSYVIDVYRGEVKPEKHFGKFAVFISFFPQLVAGPIERARNLLPQFSEMHFFNFDRAVDGLKIMLWGFFLKVVIADRLAIGVNEVYNSLHDFTGWPLFLATYYFAFQIYCDFAGYSLIAIGAAKVMGFRLMDNFKRPYLAQSISEFWSRWHISLSTWFRDYLYIPLGGNRVKKYRWYINLMIVFLASGLWHGANWTFLVWGAIHGVYLVFAIFLKPIREKISGFLNLSKFPVFVAWLKRIITFHLVLFAWIFFRANSLGDALYVVTNIFTDIRLSNFMNSLVFGKNYLLLALGLILILESFNIMQEKRSIRDFLKTKNIAIRWAMYYAILFIILLFGVFESQEFIYFQF